MIRNYIIIISRIFNRNKIFFTINILGLSIGLATCLFILTWVINEYSYNDNNRDKDRIYQVMVNSEYPDGIQTFNGSPAPLGPELKRMPEVEETCRFAYQEVKELFHYQEKLFYEKGVYADTSLFNVFTIPVIQGNPLQPLPDINSISISSKLAKKYFNDENPVGKIIRIEGEKEVKVTSVFKELPENSTLHFDFILPYTVFAATDQYNKEWGSWGAATYVKLYRGINSESLDRKINELITKPKIWPRWDSTITLFLYPMTDWRLKNNFENGKEAGGRITVVRIFTVSAIAILLLACFNFMNLATARSAARSREIGIRKVMGATRKSLVWQFMGEALVFTFISMVAAVILVNLLSPLFNEMLGKEMAVNFSNPGILAGIVSITLVTALIAGSYPAFFLSSYNTVNIMKGGTFNSPRGASVRRILVVMQFSASIVIILYALIIYNQIKYIRNKDLGFDKNHIAYFDASKTLISKFDYFRNKLLQNPLISDASRSDSNPMDICCGIDVDYNAWPGMTRSDNTYFQYLKCDENFLRMFHFRFAEGRDFSKDLITDSSNYIINESAARQMRLNDPIGTTIKFPKEGNIVGVVKDFHGSSLKYKISSLVIAMRPGETNQVFFKYQPGKLNDALTYVKSTVKEFDPNYPVEFTFFDQKFNQLYAGTILSGKLALYFTIIAILLSGLGLFGIVTFTLERNLKQIGIRKILGASVQSLIGKISGNFIKWLSISSLLGIPFAYLFTKKFLAQFAYHTPETIWPYFLTVIGTLIFILLLLIFKSLKTVNTNPVDILREE